MTWRRFGLALAVPKMAALLLSVAQLVNRICLRIGQTEMPGDLPCGPAPIAAAAGRAGSYIELGLKYSAVRNGVIASTTSGATWVVALLST